LQSNPTPTPEYTTSALRASNPVNSAGQDSDTAKAAYLAHLHGVLRQLHVETFVAARDLARRS